MTHRDDPSDLTFAISDDNAPLPPARRPTRWTVRRGRAIAFVLVGLALAVALGSVYLTYRSSEATYRSSEASAEQAASANARINVLEQDLADRRQQRDAERDAATARDAATREEIRAVLCELLAQLPAEPLDQVRQLLACDQPGVTSTGAGEQPALPPPAAGDEPPASTPTGAPPTPSVPSSPAVPAPTGPPAAPPTAQPAPPTSVVCALLSLPLLC